MNATPRLLGVAGPYPLRSLGALLAIVLFACGLFSLAQVPAAHASSGATATKQQTAPRTATGKVDTSEAALRAAARRDKKSGHKTARASSFNPSIRWEWWGARVFIDRDASCFLAADHPWGYAALMTIPPPWNVVAVAAVKAYKGFLAMQMGSEGVELHFNWSGTLHWIAPRGVPQPYSC